MWLKKSLTCNLGVAYLFTWCAYHSRGSFRWSRSISLPSPWLTSKLKWTSMYTQKAAAFSYFKCSDRLFSWDWTPGRVLPTLDWLSALFDHWRVVLRLCFKASLGAWPFTWKWVFIHMQIKLIFSWKVVHQASLWKRGTRQHESGLFTSQPKVPEFLVNGQQLACVCLSYWLS